MNSRERLLKTLAHQPTDRVPVSTYELVGYNSSSFENQESSYARLMETIRRETDCVCMWNPESNETFLQSSHPVEMEVLEQRENGARRTESILQTPRGPLRTITEVKDNIHTVWRIEHWCKSLEEVEAALSVPFSPLEYDTSDFDRIQDEVGENGIIMASIPDPLLLAADLMDFASFTLWAMTEEEHFARTVAILHERFMENLRRMLDVNLVDLYRICGPEYATPPFLPPRFFEKYVTPYVREIVELIHSRGSRVRLHCHGRIGKVLDLILDTGADALDPCEAPPDGDIHLSEVKARVGHRICLFGNIQLKLLEHGSTEEVDTAVRSCMESARKNGGYVLMPTAAPINVPLDPKTEANYLTYIEAGLKYGRY